jgi:hypothetical protein
LHNVATLQSLSEFSLLSLSFDEAKNLAVTLKGLLLGRYAFAVILPKLHNALSTLRKRLVCECHEAVYCNWSDI